MSTETQATSTAAAEASETPKRRFNPIAVALVLAILAVGGVLWYLYAQTYEDTDDAQIEGHLDPISSRIDGTITAVHVDDNDAVKAGQPLVELDPADNRVALAQAQAQYDEAMAKLNAANPNVPITRSSNVSDLASEQAEVANAEAALAAAQNDYASDVARLTQAQATNERAQADFARYKVLFDKQEAAKADFDQYRSAADAQAAAVSASQSQVAAAQKVIAQRQAQLAEQQAKLKQIANNAPLQLQIREDDVRTQQAGAESAAAQLEQAKLNLGYTKIVAPLDGVVTQRAAEVGAHVSAGQQLMMIVETGHLWVTANFKETQLARMHPGQHARIHVDALKRDFEGTVESMPAATGSATSVLPPENATGNYVKVVQRLPVRIGFNSGQRDLDKLRPGMSVEPEVKLN